MSSKPVAPERIRVIHGDTDRTPYGFGTFASRSAVISGGASLLAAQKVRAKLIKIASLLLEAAPDDIVLEEGAAKVAGTDRSIPIEATARLRAPPRQFLRRSRRSALGERFRCE